MFKKITTIIAIILMISMTFTLIALPNADAHTPPATVQTYAYLSVMPNPVGIGQTAYIGFWLDKLPPTAYQQYGDRWHNFTVTVTKPDGKTETLGPFTSDDAGGAHTTYVPDQLGNYSFIFSFSGETVQGSNPSPLIGTYNSIFVGDYFAPSTSAKETLIVQQDPVTLPSSNPLPTNYWTRPIESLNNNWYSIGGNWLGYTLGSGGGGAGGGYYNNTENFNPYTTAPNTAHIMWTKPYSFGGTIGGEFGGSQYGSNYNSNNMYQPKWGGIIINGVVYYNLVPGSTANTAGWVALDLRTGQTIWTKNTTAVLRTGELINYISPNQYGAFPYLWALEPSNYYGTTSGAWQYNNTWEMYDAMTGNWILNIINGPTSPVVINSNLTINIALIPTLADDASGNLIGYYVNSSTANQWKAPTLVMWNSTLAITQYAYLSGRSVNTWVWTPPQGASIDWGLGIQWIQPLATNVTATNGTSISISPGLSISKLASDVLLMTSTPQVGSYAWEPGYVFEAGYSAVDGHLLWGPIMRDETPWCRMTLAATALNGAYYEFNMETMSWRAFSIQTGQLIWGPVALNNAKDIYGYYSQSAVVAYGGLYMSDLGGYVYGLNATTGAIMWTFSTGNAGLSTPYGEYPLYNLEVAADGKIYVLGGHLYSPPLYNGALLYCLNASTGQQIWNIPSFVITNQPNCAIADGYLLMPNAYDNQLYCYGMGPSRTTVNAPGTGITTTSPVTITGTVTDISAGSQQNAVSANYPNGLPCVSDDSMTPFMEAVYMQQPMPNNITGIPVTISVLDSNGNNRVMGTTTTNANGFYSLTWTPDIPGNYTVTATFAGSQSYYGSSANTAFYASSSGITASPQPVQAQPPVEMYFAISTIAIIVAIAIGFALTLLAFRKRQ